MYMGLCAMAHYLLTMGQPLSAASYDSSTGYGVFRHFPLPYFFLCGPIIVSCICVYICMLIYIHMESGAML